MRVLRALQRNIEAINDVSAELDVAAYIVDDQVRSGIPGANEDIPELLFVHEEDGEIELALYLAPSIVEKLAAQNPHESLTRENFEEFCIATEGVSHFVFLAYRAQLGRPVSALELEIQAEVDKFVGSWILLGQQGTGMETTATPLIEQLFESYEVREGLNESESSRYHTASKVARRYCRGLAKRYAADGSADRVVRDVRKFYRRGLAEKIRAA